MRPYYADDWLTVYHGDCRAVMAGMEPESVHCVVTSPPYWGLRDYGSVGQLGLEPTPEEYVANLVAVFREVRRVLRKDGTVWLNLGDSYSQSANTGGTASIQGSAKRMGAMNGHTRPIPSGLKPKDLVGIPWRVAFALQADGWYLRSDIIWAKPNPMPESVTDRPTKSHEYIFLLSKSPRYYFDADAVAEAADPRYEKRYAAPFFAGDKEQSGNGRADGMSNTVGIKPFSGTRNIRSVWTMATQPYPGAHFATFPESLPERCIKAGTSEKGVCPECGAPWERVVEREGGNYAERKAAGVGGPYNMKPELYSAAGSMGGSASLTTGWRPSCLHPRYASPDHLAQPVPATVLDPFAGSGTTGMVAQSLSRRAVLIDLSLDYLDQVMARNADIPLGLGA